MGQPYFSSCIWCVKTSTISAVFVVTDDAPCNASSSSSPAGPGAASCHINDRLLLEDLSPSPLKVKGLLAQVGGGQNRMSSAAGQPMLTPAMPLGQRSTLLDSCLCAATTVCCSDLQPLNTVVPNPCESCYERLDVRFDQDFESYQGDQHECLDSTHSKVGTGA